MSEAASSIQVVYALPVRQIIVTLDLSPGMTAAEAVQRSGLPELFPEIGQRELVLGIWGEVADPECVLSAGDRVEISRPLVADPRDMRRDLMQGGRVMGGAVLEKLRKRD